MLRALTDTSVELEASSPWVIDLLVLDADGNEVTEQEVTATLTSPTGSQVTDLEFEQQTSGVYRLSVVPDGTGRSILTATNTDYGTLSFAVWVTSTSPSVALPTTAEIKAYGKLGTSWSDDQIQDALDGESSQQRAMCDVGAVYPADLREALKRRVIRNLAMRDVIKPSSLLGDADTGNSGYAPFNDPEIRRLEAPWRKVVLF